MFRRKVTPELEGASGVLIELEADYVVIARRRLVQAGRVQYKLTDV